MRGIKYENGVRASNSIERIPGVLKRGIWAFKPTDYKGAPTINIGGQKLTLVELQKLIDEKSVFMQARRKMMEHKKPIEEEG